MLIAICVAVQFIMRSRQVGRKQVKKAGERQKKESREAEVEQARMLLDDDNMDDTEVTDLEDDDDLETDYDDVLDSEDSVDGDYDEDEGYLDDDLESGYDNLDFDDDFKIIELDLNEVEGSSPVTAETVAGRLPLLYFGSNVV